MKAAIIGLPQSGKSTAFAAATGLALDPHLHAGLRHGVAKVPDPRLQYLAKLTHPKKIVEETIDFMDVPGCSLDTPAGLDEWRRVLPEVRKADTLVIVSRDFQNPAVPAYKDRIDPAADCSVVWDELLFSDLEQVSNRLDKLDKSLKKPSKSHDQEKREQALLEKCKASLDAGTPISEVVTSEEDRRLVASFAFLTQRPIVVVRNVGDDRLHGAEPLTVPHAVESLSLCATIEAEITSLEAADRQAFLADYGIEEPARDRLVRACYKACGLISFLTMGPDECRAWAIPAGSTAQEAAGKIHTDLARGFVRAETVAYADLVAHTDMKGVKAAGKLRKEGKGYIVQDGDVLLILAST